MRHVRWAPGQSGLLQSVRCREYVVALLSAGCCSLSACSEEPAGGAQSAGPGPLVSSAGAGSLQPAPSSSGPSMPGAPPGPPPTATPDALMEAPPPAMNVVLESFEDGDGQLAGAGFTGRWRTYSDGTAPITPPVDAEVVPVDGAVHVSGAGFSTWGAGLSVDLNNPSGQVLQRQPADLSAHRGLGLRARGTGTIVVELVTPATTGADEGGACTGDGCFGHYAASITLGAEYAERELPFSSFAQPEWAQSVPLELGEVLAINFLARAEAGQPSSLDLWLDEVTLLAPLPPPVAGGGSVVGGGGLGGDAASGNPFAGRTLDSDGGAASGAYGAAQGMDRELLGKIAMHPAAFWLVGGDPSRAGSIARGAGDDYPVLVAYNIPNRDCSGQSAGGAGSPAEYQGWIDAMSSSLMGEEAAIILEPDALALSCGDSTESLIAYAVSSLRRNPGTAVYIDGGHSNWVSAGEMAGRLRNANIAEATGFAINVSNFQPTDALLGYGRNLSAQVGGKPFVVDTSRNARGVPGGAFCNPAGTGLGLPPTADTGEPLAHAFLWVKRPGESDGACGQCPGTPAGQFCRDYALELARNAAF